MFGITDLTTYVLGTLFIVLLPGPNSMYVLSVASGHGVAMGYRAACGVFVGDTVLMVLSAAGLASVLQATPWMFLAIKYAGALYLAWIGIGMLRSAWARWRGDVGVSQPLARPPQATRPFQRALSISLLNPKAIFFFISFFVQFVDPAYPHPALSFVVLGAIAQLFSFVYLSALIFAGDRLAAAFRRQRRLAASLNAGVGALFVGFGIRLAKTTSP
ncbi:leucine efflux protein LeuE [Tepidimonas sp.]|uniref:leucine efflux protein LeuE n=1 Tax=Tepidimonas sp. TaxID=2002775 RepID=UPI002FE1D24D